MRTDRLDSSRSELLGRGGAGRLLGEECRRVLAAVTDLVLPGTCAGCGSRVAPLCAACWAVFAGGARPAWPQPAPSGLPCPWAVACYAGPARAALLAYKERGRAALADALAQALATALRAAAVGCGQDVLLVVPVPSSAAAVRARGEDPLLRLATRATAQVRSGGLPVQLVKALRHSRQVADQAGLGTAARTANLTGALAVPPRLAPALQGRVAVVVDDVVTTGTTLAEAARALRAAGASVPGAAVVAATQRRRTPPPGRVVPASR